MGEALQASQQPNRQVKADIRALLVSAKNKQHDLAGDGKKLEQLLEKADEQLEHVTNTREEVIDSELFVVMTESGAKLIKNLASGNRQHSPADFVRRLISRYVRDADAQATAAEDPKAFNWSEITSTRLKGWFQPGPICYHMLGPMAAAPAAKRVMTQRRKRASVGEAVRPDEIDALDNEEKQETDKNMEVMWSILRNRNKQGIDLTPLLELVMNHESFSQTVENLFTLSFLVKDNRVALKQSPQGVAVSIAAAPQSKRTKDAANNNNNDGATTSNAMPVKQKEERVQFVVSLDYDEWEMWKKVTKPEDSLMPHRNAPVHHNNNNNNNTAVSPEDALVATNNRNTKKNTNRNGKKVVGEKMMK